MYLVILAILFAVALAWAALRRPRRVPALTPALIGLALAAGITSLTAQIPADSQLSLVTWSVVIVFYMILTELDRPLLENILYAFLVALAEFAILISVVLTVQALVAGRPLDYLELRATGLVGHANILAVIMVGATALGTRRLLDTPPERRRWATFELIVVYVALVMTVSRGGWLSWLAGVVVVALLIAPVRRTLLTPRWLVAGVVVLALTNPQTVRTLFRLANSGGVAASVAAEATDSGRMPVWLGAIGYFKQHLLVGLGPWNFGPFYNAGAPPGAFYWGHAHNVVLTFAAEEGIVGLLALAGVAVVAGRSLWRGLHDDQRREGAALATALAAALLVNGMFDYAYYGWGTILLLLLIWNRLLPDSVPDRWRPWVTWAAVGTVGLMGVVEWIIVR